jgi:HK97 family phage portal protein
MLRNTQLVEQTSRPARSTSSGKSYSEENITVEVSLTVSAVLAAFTILSEDISSLPLLLYARSGRNKFRDTDSAYYRLMHDQPNPEQTSMVFREIMVGHLLAWGNFYGQLIIDKRGDVQEIWALRPDRMTVERKNGEKIYTYQTSNGKPRVFFADELLHIPAFGFDGLIGYSRIALARNAIGLAISTEKFGGKFFSNGANLGVIYKHPGELSDKAFERLENSIKEKQSGVENAHKALIIEEGMSIEKIGIPPDDAQFLETRKFQVSEIARIFRVPPHMIGDVERSTSWGSGIDSQEQGYVNHTLRPWCKRIEEHLNMRLLMTDERKAKFYEHLMDGLLRGDIATRYQAYVSAINNGFMSRNEARERENLNPRKGLDVMLMPLNMTTVSGDVNNSDADSNQTAVNQAMMPLWKDATARAMKREQNDVLGASKRYQAKGQQEAFAEWSKNFYQVEHPAFVKKQFQSIFEAQYKLSKVDGSADFSEFIESFLSIRLKEVLAMSANQLVSQMDSYLNEASDVWLKHLSSQTDLIEETYEEFSQ